MMKEIGESGQRKLGGASVLVIGCGGLGSPALFYLTAMGIGHIGLCDMDVVSTTNMNRQILYTLADIGEPKAVTAEKRLLALNPALKTTVYDRRFDSIFAGEIVPSYDIAVDCLDNFETRFILNDACIAAKKPFVHAGIGEFYGQLMTVTPGKGPCLRCLFPDEKEKKTPEAPFGVIGATPGVIGAFQALEVCKYLLGLPVNDDGLVLYNGMNLSLDKVPLKASENCICRT